MTIWETLDFRHELTDMPERQLDPPDTEDMTPKEQREQRAQIIRDMPLEVMADMVADAAGELSAMFSVEYALQERRGVNMPNNVGAQYVGERVCESLRPRINAYIEHQLTGRVTGD